MDIVVFPLADWKKCQTEGFRTRDAHITLELAKRDDVNKILVVDRPTSIAEMILMRRSWRVSGGQVIYKQGNVVMTHFAPKIYVLDILQWELWNPVIQRRKWWFEIFSREEIHQTIRKAITPLDLLNFHLMIFAPPSVGVVGRLGETHITFCAVDNWLHHPQMKRIKPELVSGYETFKQEADAIITTSENLRQFFIDAKSQTIAISNGVDVQHFATTTKIPDDLQKLATKPIVGYAGKMQERLDIDMITYAAENLPDVNFVVIGQLLASGFVSKLFKLPNVHYLGDKTFDDLPAYLHNFDVCIIPHKVSPLTQSMSPLKFYEYLAAGRPIVSTEISGVTEFNDWVYIAQDNEDFLNGITTFLTNPPTKSFQVPEEWSWQSKTNEFVAFMKATTA